MCICPKLSGFYLLKRLISKLGRKHEIIYIQSDHSSDIRCGNYLDICFILAPFIKLPVKFVNSMKFKSENV